MMSFVTIFVIGVVVGGWAGILLMCAMFLAKKADESEGGGP